MNFNFSQQELMRLAEEHEKGDSPASDSKPAFRKATCVRCGIPMVEMLHVWLKFTDKLGQKWVKELHFCRDCSKKYRAK